MTLQRQLGKTVAALQSLRDRQNRRADRAIEAERIDGVRLAAWLRLMAMAVVGAYATAIHLALDDIGFIYFAQMAGLVLVWLLGVARYRTVAAGHRHPLILGLFPVLDNVVLALLIALPATWGYGVPAPYLQFDRPFIWFMLLLVLQGLGYRPWLAAWGGIVTAAVWFAVMQWMLQTPDAHTGISTEDWRSMWLAQDYSPIADPMLVREWAWHAEILAALMIGFMLAAIVARSQRLIVRGVLAERARANLSRFFSTAMVDRLQTLEGLDRPQTATVGVIFADIVAFTRFAEDHTPEQVIALLREFHGRMVGAAFAHDGAVDKFIGDAVMVTFGTPIEQGREAVRTLACAVAMADTVAAWNRERALDGAVPVRIGIGAHFGPVVMGGIGDERRLEFTVLGDTVNVAARLEKLTRSVEGEIVISDDLAAAAHADDAEVTDRLLAAFTPLPHSRLRGRGGLIGLQVKPCPG